MEKLFKAIEKAADKGATKLSRKTSKLTDEISGLEITLNNKKTERGILDNFADKLRRIVAIIKE